MSSFVTGPEKISVRFTTTSKYRYSVIILPKIEITRRSAPPDRVNLNSAVRSVYDNVEGAGGETG